MAKQVFSSTSEVCHVWAQQTQPSGRAGNVFFRDSMIFSYGEHYLAAQFHTRKKQTAVLVNSNHYSNSTAKHLSRIRSAIHSVPSFTVPCPGTPRAKENRDYQRELVTSAVDHVLAKIKITSRHDIDYQLNYITRKLNTTNGYLKWAGFTPIRESAIPFAKVEFHLAARLKRHGELNTPAMIAARKAKAEAEEQRKDALRLATQADNIVGQTIGHYTVRELTDTVVTIGCHAIELSEARAVLA